MKVKYLLVAIFCLCFVAENAFSQDVIKAADFGVKSNSFENAATGIKRAINACKTKNNTVLVLPGGRIDIWPDEAEKRELYISNCTESDTLSKVKNIAFLFENSKNITVEGNHTLVVLHGKMISFAIINSQNIKINNIRIDYQRPTMSELTIKSVTNNVIETEIHPDSKYVIDSDRICFFGEGWKTNSYHTILFNPERNTLHYSTFDPFLSAKAVETRPFNVRFVGDFSKTQFKPGQTLTIRDPYRDNCGGFISLSKNIWLNDVKMHYMHGLGMVSQFSENMYFNKVAVAPRENSGRVIASFADCFHFSGCRGKVLIDSCFTSGSHDDPINVHGTHLQVTGIDNAKKITVRFMHNQTYGFPAFFADDSIAFVNPKSLLPLAVATVKSAKLINKKEMELELNQPIPASMSVGHCIENLTWTPEVKIQNSRFERTNTRGLLITTRRKVLIENNVFYRTGMYPILIANDASSWFESGAVQDVVVRNNVFEECGYNSGSGAINIAPENHELDAIVHRNIRIMDNTFKVFNNAVLSARSVDYLTFTGNKIIYPQPNVKGISRGATVHLTACKHVLINKNFDFQGVLQVNTSKMNINDIKSDSKVDVQESR